MPTYTTGSANNMDAVKTALVNACVADGWTNQTDSAGKTVLSKSGTSIFVRIESITDAGFQHLQCLGRTEVSAGDAPDVVQMREFTNCLIGWPVTYHIFTFPYEIFLVIGYSDKYQWLAFGQSQQAGLNGTGNWVAATIGKGLGNATGFYYNNRTLNDNISISPDCGQSGFPTPAMFWGNNKYNYNTNCGNYHVHNGLSNVTNPWIAYYPNFYNVVGIKYLTELLQTQPNAFNSEAVLLPIRGYATREASKVSQVLEVENARHLRIDNYAPEQIITLGTENWMVFPYYRKNLSARDGGILIDHTGTFGWAIKKP